MLFTIIDLAITVLVGCIVVTGLVRDFLRWRRDITR
jgi:Tfp pilus assembly protein PilW